MSNTNPVSLAFDVQRNTVEATHEAVTKSLEAQREVSDTFVDFGPAKQVQEHTTDATRTAIDMYFDAVEATVPGVEGLLGDARSTVHEQLETFEATQTDALETVEASLQDSTVSVDERMDAVLSVLDEQIESFLEAHEDVEARTVEAFDGYEGDLEDLRAEFESQGEVARETFESQLEQFESQMTEMLGQLEGVSENVVEAAETQVSAQIDAVDATSDSLESINGLGPTYADRLLTVGIESIEALADANAEAVAEAAEVTEKKATEWIEAAQSWD